MCFEKYIFRLFSPKRHTSVDSSSIISSRITPSFGKRKFPEESSDNPPAKSKEIPFKVSQVELPLHRKSTTTHAPRDDTYMKVEDSNDQVIKGIRFWVDFLQGFAFN